MASKVVSRLWYVWDATGQISVLWDLPQTDSPRVMRVELIGPRAVEPPVGPMSKEQFDRWTWELCSSAGYSQQFTADLQMDAPKVEVLPERGVPRAQAHLAAVTCDLSWQDKDGVPETLVVSVTNAGSVALPDLSVHWSWDNEVPQEVEGLGVHALDAGGSFKLYAESSFDGTLHPGNSRSFLLDARAMPSLRGRVASLSPERYRIVIVSGDQQVGTVDGAELGGFVEQLDS